ncbi:hypothetical protein ACFQL4_05925 [Halosimplex aquaticum]
MTRRDAVVARPVVGISSGNGRSGGGVVFDGGFERLGLGQRGAGAAFDLAVDCADVPGVAADGLQSRFEFRDPGFELRDSRRQIACLADRVRGLPEVGQVGAVVGQRALDGVESRFEVSLGHGRPSSRHRT